MTYCPVCGNPVDPKTAPSYEYKGTTYYFRCHGCLSRFVENPEQYLKAGPHGCCHQGHSHGGHGCH